MIFIDTVNRIKQLPERDTGILRRKYSRPETDSLSLSDAATHVQQIVLTYQAATQLTPTDSIIANILETLLQQLDRTNLTVEALSTLAPREESWSLTLQTPPIEQASSESPSYADKLKKAHQHADYKTFELSIYGRNGAQKICHISFLPHHLEPSLLNNLHKLQPQQEVRTPYTQEQLDPLPQNWLFEIDQDGEPDPLHEIYDKQDEHRTTYLAKHVGLQIWFERHQDALPLLISDQKFGYIYIGNYEVNIERPETSEHNVPRIGDIDTSA